MREVLNASNDVQRPDGKILSDLFLNWVNQVGQPGEGKVPPLLFDHDGNILNEELKKFNDSPLVPLLRRYYEDYKASFGNVSAANRSEIIK